MFSALITRWRDAKTFLEYASNASMDALHVVLGVVLLLALAKLSRRPVSSWLPWLGVLAVVFANEVLDMHTERWPDLTHQLAEGAKDVVLTMLIPTLLMVTARLQPKLYGVSETTGEAGADV
ncbi:MAG TPA: hypothetical protein VNH53_05315 [Sphingomicrobium sp.]|jgi:hypothetical protein|nr:hypothetical protein [Sphingomicrobium sp.]